MSWGLSCELLLDKMALTINNENYVNSQQFLLLNIAILLIFIIWFFAGRRGSSKKSTQLRMRQGNSTPGGVLQKGNSTRVQGRYSHPRFQQYLDEKNSPDMDCRDPESPGKNLNVLFNYNGHTWDAYEVLGLPAGANIVDVTTAYQNILKSAASESHEFLETAFKTILEKK